MINILIKEIREERRWFRKCLGILTLHTLQQATKENTRGNKWRVQDTAQLLGLSIGYVSESIALAKAFPKNIHMEFLTRDQALKLLKEDHHSDFPKVKHV